MTWPQVVVLAILIWSLTVNTLTAARNKNYSSTDTALYVLITVVLLTGYAAVLHAGGFW